LKTLYRRGAPNCEFYLLSSLLKVLGAFILHELLPQINSPTVNNEREESVVKQHN